MVAYVPARQRERAFVRAAARGVTARQAALAAGYHPDYGPRAARRLATEIDHEKRRLGGTNGGAAPPKFSPRDARRIARMELERIVDYCGPNHANVTAQRLRALAAQMPRWIANELVISYGNKRCKARQNSGGDPVRLGLLVHFAGQLLAEVDKIERLKSASAAAEGFSCGRKASVVTGSDCLTGTHTHESAREAAWCPNHPSQPRDRCRLCDFAQAAPAVPERWGDEW